MRHSVSFSSLCRKAGAVFSYLLAAALFFTLLLAVSCGIKAHELRLSPGALSLTPGSSAQLTALCSQEGHRQVRYESSDTSVARVDGNGLVTAVAQGKATVTATCEGGTRPAKAQCLVTVDVMALELRFQEYGGALPVGESCRLTATLLKNDRESSETVRWSYEGADCVSLRENGNILFITGLTPGECTVTASYGDGLRESRSIRVVSGESYELTLSRGSLQLYPEETAGLSAFVTSGDTPWEGTVTWSSANPSVASVGPDGTVTAKAPGSTIITASALPGDGDKLTAPCLVTVNENDYEVTIEYTETALHASEKLRLTATLTRNEKPFTGKIRWSVNDPAAATAEQDGTITLLAPGFVTVYADYTSPEGKEIRDSLQLRVLANDYALRLAEVSSPLAEEETLQLRAAAEKNGEAYTPELFWVSSDPEVLTVDDSGLVTALREGTATVTVSFRPPLAEGGEPVEAAVTFKVRPIVYELELSADADALWVGDSLPLTARRLRDGEAFSQGEILYAVSDESAAILEGAALRGLKPGEVEVTARWTDPRGKEHSARLSVGIRSRYYITLEPTEISLPAGSELQFSAETLQRLDDGGIDDCYEGFVSWQSSDENVATVSGGVLKAYRPGATAVITAAWTAPDGTVAVARCTVTVTEAVNNG